jgi:hypothetical protein
MRSHYPPGAATRRRSCMRALMIGSGVESQMPCLRIRGARSNPEISVGWATRAPPRDRPMAGHRRCTRVGDAAMQCSARMATRSRKRLPAREVERSSSAGNVCFPHLSGSARWARSDAPQIGSVMRLGPAERGRHGDTLSKLARYIATNSVCRALRSAISPCARRNEWTRVASCAGPTERALAAINNGRGRRR